MRSDQIGICAKTYGDGLVVIEIWRGDGTQLHSIRLTASSAAAFAEVLAKIANKASEIGAATVPKETIEC